MTAYLDSSAAVKLFVADEGDREDPWLALSMFGLTLTNRLTYVETRAALAAARRSGRVSAADFAAAVDRFEQTWASFLVVELTQDLASDAADVADAYGLRAGDAIQLATVRRTAPEDVTVVAWDTRLRAAAIVCGYACYPPEV